ncbi:MAG: hypothetical protein QFX32_05450 [Methanolinea sp.]|nr:hypothetical protein [Methanolinea sp.]
MEIFAGQVPTAPSGAAGAPAMRAARTVWDVTPHSPGSRRMSIPLPPGECHREPAPERDSLNRDARVGGRGVEARGATNLGDDDGRRDKDEEDRSSHLDVRPE